MGSRMETKKISLRYEQDDDILYVTFGNAGRKGMGVNLHENILLRFDRHTAEPLGLTLIDYSKLKDLSSLPLHDLSTFPEDLKQILQRVLLTEPVQRFLEVDSISWRNLNVVNPTMARALAA